MTEQTSWIIFDADNTLWNVEQLYDAARAELCRFLANHGLDVVQVEQFQQERDKDLYALYGYSACRFARSFEDTVLNFLPEAAPQLVVHARRLALDVFEQPAEVADGLLELLDRLTVAKYSLAIITAGERWVQERRLSDFHLRDKFAVVDIVEAKTEKVFRDFSDRRNVAPSSSWIVGDSINSDILPAKSAGLNAVLVRAANWSRVEGKSIACPTGVPVIEKLADLLGVLKL